MAEESIRVIKISAKDLAGHITTLEKMQGQLDACRAMMEKIPAPAVDVDGGKKADRAMKLLGEFALALEHSIRKKKFELGK